MVMYRKVPSSVFRDAGYRSKKDAIEHLTSLHVLGYQFNDVEALSAYMLTVENKPEKPVKKKPKRTIDSQAAAAVMASIDDEPEKKDAPVEMEYVEE